MKYLLTALFLALVFLSASSCANSQSVISISNTSTTPNDMKPTNVVPSGETVTPPEQTEEPSLPTDAIHTDSISLYGQTYEIMYWNEGEFDYTRFSIIKNKKLLFDSAIAGISMEGGMKADKDGTSWAEGIEQNNRPTFLFKLADNRPDEASIVVEELDKSMQVTVHDNSEVWFEDVDDNGSKELLGLPSYGQIPLSPALTMVYTWKDNQYEPNPSLTHHYWESQLKKREQKFQEDPNEMTLDSLLSAYLLLNNVSEAKEQFATFYKWAASKNVDDGFITDYKQYLNDAKLNGDRNYTNWMSQREPLQK